MGDLIDHFNSFTHEQPHILRSQRERVVELYSRLKDERRSIVYKGEIKVYIVSDEEELLQFIKFMSKYVDYSDKLKESVWMLTVDQIVDIICIIDQNRVFKEIFDQLIKYYPNITL